MATMKYKKDDGTWTKVSVATAFSPLESFGKYAKDESGNYYTIHVDGNGGLYLKSYIKPEIPKSGLIVDLDIADNAVVNKANEQVFDKFTITDDGFFYGDGNRYATQQGTNILPDGTSIQNLTIVLLTDFDTGFYNLCGLNGNLLYPFRRSTTSIIDFSGNVFDKNFGMSSYSTTFSPDVAKIARTKKGGFSGLQFVSVGRDTERNVLVVENEFTSNGTISSETEKQLTSLVLPKESEGIGCKTKRVLVYDRMLTEKEVIEIRDAIYNVPDRYYYPDHYVQGIASLGTPNNIIAENNDVSKWSDESVDYTTVDWTEPTVEDIPSNFEQVLFTDPINEMKVGEIYNLEALPYPFKINDADWTYNVEYTSSNNSVIECYDGVLFAKKVGSATITAKISNTNITNTITIKVTEASVVTENYIKLSEGYMSSDFNTFTDEDYENVMRAITSAIYTAKEAGYNGIVFPKMDYHIKPFQSGINCLVPTDFTIDFNGSNMYCHDSDYCQDSDNGHYVLFSFGKHGNNGSVFTACKNSIIRNLNYYGERYQELQSDTYYSPGCHFAHFSAGGVENCHLTDIVFTSTTGFHISTGMCGFDVWQGTGLDGARRGCTIASDYSAGRLADDGATVQEDNTGMWYCTPELLKLGFTYADEPTASPQMKYYTVGTMGTATRHGTSGWWYELFFFDENEELIQATGLQMGLERYVLPEDAVYFKINIASWKVPVKTSQVDVEHVVRLWAVGDPYKCTIERCKFIDPHCSAVSWTGGYNCAMIDCYAEQGQQVTLSNGTYGWSIDFEDGWLEMKHNIMYKVMCGGLIPNPGGYNTAYINCAIKSLTSGGSAQMALKVINSVVDTINCKYKTNDYFNNVTHNTMTNRISSDVGTGCATVRIVNDVQDTSLNLF